MECKRCHGAGYVGSRECPDCDGTGSLCDRCGGSALALQDVCEACENDGGDNADSTDQD